MTATPHRPGPSGESGSPGSGGLLIFAWLFVSLPLAWGVYSTLLKSLALFQ